ncbi:PilW family protein [bacterium]|nr:PilW family protein [bacterium]
MKKSILHNRNGISLPELLVAVILVGMLMSSTFYVFSTFFAKSLTQERQTLSHADTQVGTQFIKWDMFMAGYGIPSNVIPITCSDNTGVNGSDVLTIQSVSFGMSGNTGKWSYILSPVSGSNQITVRRWNNPDNDLTKDDYIIILSPIGTQIGFPVYQITDTTSAIGPAGQDAWILTLNNVVYSSLNFVFKVSNAAGPAAVTYSIQNGNLARDSTLFISDVVNFQVTFWIDTDGDRQIDAGEMYNDLSAVISNPSLLDNIDLMRISIVTATRGEQNYYYPQDTIYVGNQSVNVENIGRNLKYQVWESTIKPRNL